MNNPYIYGKYKFLMLNIIHNMIIKMIKTGKLLLIDASALNN